MRTIIFGLLFVVAIPVVASAQATIAGSVKDPSGNPLPGVAVEVGSAVLIEGTRNTHTDIDGRYRIENLRPGTYVVRFALDGWSPTERSDIELSGAVTTTVDATFALALQQSVSVTSEPTLIDTYSAHHEVTFGNDL